VSVRLDEENDRYLIRSAYNAHQFSADRMGIAVHHYQDLITLFNQCFETTYNTRLVKGGDEPIYLPANAERALNEIHFAHGFFSSALHECAHWFIAGEARRQQIDFGYWYAPDGRTAEQQMLFQSVEVKPQALEWILSTAAGHQFRISIDNLNGEEADTLAFKYAVHQQVHHYCKQGLPERARQFHIELCRFYNQPDHMQANYFDFNDL
jgi:elongation factor P hydroxylase